MLAPAVPTTLGLADHWGNVEGPDESFRPNILVRLDLSADDGSFSPHKQDTNPVRACLAAMRAAELQAVAFGGRKWVRYPAYITSQAGLEPLWEIIDELYQLWPEPVKTLLPLLEDGEPPEFEAVWRKLSKRGGSFCYKVRSPATPRVRPLAAGLPRVPFAPAHRLATSKGRTTWPPPPAMRDRLFPGWQKGDDVERWGG